MNELGLVIREGASRVAAFSIEYVALTSQHYIFFYTLDTSGQNSTILDIPQGALLGWMSYNVV